MSTDKKTQSTNKDVPETVRDIVSPYLYPQRRILIGSFPDPAKGGRESQLWMFFAKKPKDGSHTHYCYRQPLFGARAKAKFIHEVISSTVPHQLRDVDKKTIEYAEDLAGELWGVPPHRYAKEIRKARYGSSKKKHVEPEDEDHSPPNPKKKKPTAPRTTEKGTRPAGENVPRPERTTTKVADKKNTEDRKPEDKVLSDDQVRTLFLNLNEPCSEQVLRRMVEALKKEHAIPDTSPTELLSALRVDAQVEGTSTRLYDNCRWVDWLRDQRKIATRAEGKPRVSLREAAHMLRENLESVREYFETDD
ncbi:hypothetical protein G6514_003214 [Epicoccum nigrum]|nr:hypothetical protein G6514_003214 [Epicoccum nigrum]